MNEPFDFSGLPPLGKKTFNQWYGDSVKEAADDIRVAVGLYRYYSVWSYIYSTPIILDFEEFYQELMLWAEHTETYQEIGINRRGYFFIFEI